MAQDHDTGTSRRHVLACAMVPLNPNELKRASGSRSSLSTRFSQLPARNGPRLGQSSVYNRKLAHIAQLRCDGISVATCVFRRCRWALEHIRPFCKGTAKMVCNPAAAAAASRCPTLALSEVHATSGAHRKTCEVHFDTLNVATTAPSSIGSPSAVPVPCVSRGTSQAGMDHPGHSDSRRRRCELPFGAVRLALTPSC